MIALNCRKFWCGFSLVEVVLAIGVVSFAVLATVGLLSVAGDTNKRAKDEGSAAQRLSRSGLTTMNMPTGIQIAAVNLHSAADRAGFEQGFTITGIETLAPRPAKEWLFFPALAVLGVVVLLQRRRSTAIPAPNQAAQEA